MTEIVVTTQAELEAAMADHPYALLVIEGDGELLLKYSASPEIDTRGSSAPQIDTWDSSAPRIVTRDSSAPQIADYRVKS